MKDLEKSPADPSPARASADALPEGVEAPPRGVRIMATIRWILVAAMAAAALGAWVHWAGASPAAHAAAQYRCPMHPAVVQTMPGACPVCGMDLVAMTGDAAGPPPSPRPAAGVAGTGKYWCPMHPDVSSDDPAARCEKCGGMKLLPREPAEAPRSGDRVPGLVAVDIDAGRAQRIGIRTAVVERARLQPEVRAVGVVAADEGAVSTVYARSAGWIEDVLVKRSGVRVERGQAVATLYSPELVAAQQAHLNGIRWKENHGGDGTTASTPYGSDTAKRLELLGMAARDISELEKTGVARYAIPIRSPASGHVARRSTSAGQSVAPGAELFQIVDLSNVWVVASVFESDLDRVAVGQRATVKVSARPGQTFTGTVELVYPAVSAESRTAQARIVLRNDRMQLRPGMYVDVVLHGAPVEALVAPLDAVVDTGDHQYVFVARDGGRYEPRIVTVGVQADDRVQLLQGLSEGERVVTTANFLVDSESRLRAAVESFAAPSAPERR